MCVQLSSRTVHAHRFVLAARSDNWGVPSLASVDALGKVYSTVYLFVDGKNVLINSYPMLCIATIL